MLKTFVFFLKQLANIYGIGITYDHITSDTIYDLRITEARYTYYFETIKVEISKFNMIQMVFNITLIIGDMRIRISNDGHFELFADKINLEKIKRILGPSVLDQWISEGDARIMIRDDMFCVVGDYKISGPEINGEYIRSQLAGHIGKYIRYSGDVKKDILVTEDNDFYDHWGVGYRNALRFFGINSQVRKVIGGGSSITCQLMKNTFLTGEKTIRRKLIEAILAVLTEQYYKVPKDEIFDIYLSMLEMAPNVYGLNEGSIHYFGKPIDELESRELHILQYIIPRPLFVPEAINTNSFQFRTKVRLYLSNIWKETIDVIKFAPPYQHIHLR